MRLGDQEHVYSWFFFLITRILILISTTLLKTLASITKVFSRFIIYHLRVTSTSGRFKCIIEN